MVQDTDLGSEKGPKSPTPRRGVTLLEVGSLVSVVSYINYWGHQGAQDCVCQETELRKGE